MYKYLLCWRYLRTRYIALASVISVMLGVATMIVVNSVMAGFSEKMRDRLHGVLADIVVESEYDMNGFYNSDEVMARIKSVTGDQVEAMAPAMETYGLMQFYYGGQKFTRQVQIFGVRPEERARTGDFAEFLVNEKGDSIKPAFDVPESLRMAAAPAGQVIEGDPDSLINQALLADAHTQVSDDGAIIGWAMGTVHRGGKDDFILQRGDQIRLIYPRASKTPEPGADTFTVVGYFKSGMSENDSTHIYVPLERFQKVRLMVDENERGAVNQIQIKVKEGVDLDALKATIATALEELRPMYFRVSTWEQKQGPLLSAVAVEQSILNMLLFFIIAVAGFGILAIFSMIVVEKTRDIGVLKALGASTSGVRGIFLGYGLLLGAVGSGVGMAGGLLFVHYINTIEKWLSKVTGRKVFDDSIYYFNEIPTMVEPWTVFWIVGGALFIAAAASVWPAQRASKLHPVRALRFE
ncbi:ABC transporter permease [Singulisphaera sp. Ch08]|uniref:ABC transporter permease n=1 Tax=Singulisphaera sp. Ch08 TaxID=3120278 RepID=A0AAU7CP02_9BACT